MLFTVSEKLISTFAVFALALCIAFSSGPVLSQDLKVGLAPEPMHRVREMLVAVDGTQSTGSMLRRLSSRDVFASAELVGLVADDLDYSAVTYGPVPSFIATDADNWLLCTLIRSLDARYQAFISIEVYSPYTGLESREIPRGEDLDIEDRRFVDAAYDDTNLLIRSYLAADCDETVSDVLVATGFASEPTQIVLNITLNQIIPMTLRMIRLDDLGNPLEDPKPRMADCNPTGSPVGYRCIIALKGEDSVAPGDYRVEAELRLGAEVAIRQTVLSVPKLDE